MSFASPLMLLGLLGVAGALVLYALARRSSRRGRDAFVSPALQPSAGTRPAALRRHLPIALYAICAAALVLALARPQTTIAVPIEQATVMLVTDHSRSMAAADIKPTRLAAAQDAAGRFLDEVPRQVRVGSVAFNQRARLLQTPTTDRGRVRDGLDGLRAQGGTAAGEGLALALAAARGSTLAGAKAPPAAMILLTDGRSSNGRDPIGVAREAKKAGIPVHTVALGTSTGKLATGQSATADEATLRSIAAVSGGHFSTAADAGELQAVYRELGSRITKRDKKHDVTASFAGVGLLLLLAGGAASLASFGRLP